MEATTRPLSKLDIQSPTFWEETSYSEWGAYISDVEERLIRHAHDLFDQPAKAIEIGADGGRWSRLLADLGWQMTCTDINSETLKICQDRIPEATCIQVDIDSREIPCVDESMDMILCIEVNEVLESDWFITEASRVLGSGGALVGVFQNRNSIRGIFKNLFPAKGDSWRHYEKSYTETRRKLKSHGLEPVVEEGICWFPFQRRSNSFLIPMAQEIEKAARLRRLTAWSPWIVAVYRKE